MEIAEIAERLVACCREGREADALETLYADHAVSVEAVDMGQGRETVGRAAIAGKHAWWESAMEVHEASAKGPFLHGPDRFAVIFAADVTERASGKRIKMQEVGLYTVADGKIVREEFFCAG